MRWGRNEVEQCADLVIVGIPVRRLVWFDRASFERESRNRKLETVEKRKERQEGWQKR
jgi:hypothetical protein